MVIYYCTLKVKKTLRAINQISKNSYSTHPKGGTMNGEMDGQLTIRDKTESTSDRGGRAGPGHHFTKGSV